MKLPQYDITETIKKNISNPEKTTILKAKKTLQKISGSKTRKTKKK